MFWSEQISTLVVENVATEHSLLFLRKTEIPQWKHFKSTSRLS